MNINLSTMRAASWAAGMGVTRFIPGLAESDAIQHGTLSDREKEIYRAVFYNRTATPQVPMLFISDGSGGTGFDKETWRKIPIGYVSQVNNGNYIELECPHYVHNYEYDTISENIMEFLAD